MLLVGKRRPFIWLGLVLSLQSVKKVRGTLTPSVEAEHKMDWGRECPLNEVGTHWGTTVSYENMGLK